MIIFEMGDGTGLTAAKGAYNTRKEMINEVKPYILELASYYNYPNSIWCKISFMYGMHVLHEQKIYIDSVNDKTLNEFLTAYKGG
ncbi:hypothetical protein [Providencia phage PSTRCR_127]|nr:hypothetical protein [Providencia phage PSTRCR_127]